MKRLTVTLLLLLFAIPTFAQGPYLVSDPYPDTGAQPDEFVIVLNGTEHVSAVAFDGDGLRYLSFDLSGLWNPGPNDLTVKARNLWAESNVVPFAFTAGPPPEPGGVRVESVPGPIADLSLDEITPGIAASLSRAP